MQALKQDMHLQKYLSDVLLCMEAKAGLWTILKLSQSGFGKDNKKQSIGNYI